jgi:hypothetical protein
LYTADPKVCPLELLQLLETKNSDEMNCEMCIEFSKQEIRDALFQIEPLKAPGLDGFPTRFFPEKLEVMKADAIKGVQLFFETSHMPIGVNETAIVLLPKKKSLNL